MSALVTSQLILINRAIPKVPRDIQWMAAPALPLLKEINDCIIGMLSTTMTSKDPNNHDESKFIGKIGNNMVYSFFLAIYLATQSTKATEYVLLGINFAINLTLCYKVIRLDRKVWGAAGNIEKWQRMKNDALTELILNEFIEVMAPIAFIGSFSIAYFGPNGDTFGNYTCGEWQYKKVENLHSYVMPVVEMALLDSGSLILAGLSLWWFCRINLWHKYCKTMKRYWMYLAFRGGLYISIVSH